MRNVISSRTASSCTPSAMDRAVLNWRCKWLNLTTRLRANAWIPSSSVRRKESGVRRDEGPSCPKALSQFRDMEGSGASKGDQDELTRIEPPFDTDDPQGPLHGGIGHGDDPLRRLVWSLPQTLGQAGQGFLDPIALESGLTSEERLRRKATEPDVGIGDREFGSPLAVGDGSRVGAGTLWANL